MALENCNIERIPAVFVTSFFEIATKYITNVNRTTDVLYENNGI